jgi:acyl dehydratase
MLVHGDQSMKFYKPIRPGDKLTFRAKIVDIEDKGSGELLKINVLTTNGKGEKVVESDWGLFIRGVGSGEKPRTAPSNGQPGKEAAPEPVIAFRDIIRIPADITYRYSKASNDMNPIHIDEQVAKEAGLSGIIVHGLCTMSMTMRAIIESYLDSDPSKLKSLGVRFTAPVYPGDTIIVDGWEKGRENGHVVLGFDVTRQSDNVKVIKGGTAEVEV